MVPVFWKPELSVKNELIDQDHRYLFSLFNCLELALRSDESLKHIPDFFEQLFKYTKEHFEHEEIIQCRIKYPKYMEHKIEHQNIIESLEVADKKLKEFNLCENKIQLDELLKSIIETEIVCLAREWIVEHVIKTDMDMLPYLKHYPSNFSGR